MGNCVSLNVINFISLHARSTPLAICKFAKCMQISTWSATSSLSLSVFYSVNQLY